MNAMSSMADMAAKESRAARRSWSSTSWAESLPDQAAAAFSDLQRADEQLMKDVVTAVSENSGVSFGYIMGTSKIRRTARARQFCMWKLLDMEFSVPEVAGFFNVDRKTVYYARDHIEQKMAGSK